MNDDLELQLINGQVHTFMTSAFLEDAEDLIGALVARGLPGKLRPGRRYVKVRPVVSDDSEVAEKRAKRPYGHGIVEIWLVGEVEDGDTTFAG